MDLPADDEPELNSGGTALSRTGAEYQGKMKMSGSAIPAKSSQESRHDGGSGHASAMDDRRAAWAIFGSGAQKWPGQTGSSSAAFEGDLIALDDLDDTACGLEGLFRQGISFEHDRAARS